VHALCWFSVTQESWLAIATHLEDSTGEEIEAWQKNIGGPLLHA
jgi:hypothetical protein